MSIRVYTYLPVHISAASPLQTKLVIMLVSDITPVQKMWQTFQCMDGEFNLLPLLGSFVDSPIGRLW